jgi:non-heme chloroperoxidase
MMRAAALALALAAARAWAATPFMPETQFIESAPGLELRVLSQGAGRPLVLIPGWTMTAEIWQGQFEAFASTMRVLSFDPRGQGQSGKPAHGYDSRHRAADVEALLSHLDLNGAVLVGWSLGALDVVNALQRYGSARVRGVVLVDNSVDRNYSSGPAGDRLLEEIRTQPYEAVIRNFIPSIFQAPPPAQRLQALQQASLQTPAFAARESLAKASSGAGLAAALRRTGLPCLYMVTPRFAAEGHRLEAALGSQIHTEIFEKSGHALFIDEPEHFNRSLKAFLDSLP